MKRSNEAARLNEIRRRFVRGLLLDMSPDLLREFVTGIPADEEDEDVFLREVA